MGGLTLGLQKKEAAEFSFFLAVPTMAAATLYKLLKIYKTIQHDQVGLLLTGTFVSFVVAMLAIRFFMGIVTRYGFRGFGYYRIVLGVIILILLYTGHHMQAS